MTLPKGDPTRLCALLYRSTASLYACNSAPSSHASSPPSPPPPPPPPLRGWLLRVGVYTYPSLSSELNVGVGVMIWLAWGCVYSPQRARAGWV